MAVAKLYSTPEPGGPRVKGKPVAPVETTGAAQSSVSHARTVLAVLPEAADAVLAGTLPMGSR